ncbi:MAG: hypothetical protein LBH00_12690, partial [Planctomycetaceae bacterium]|nr:hypothetical protein [Planctomycetaceae bacterium]
PPSSVYDARPTFFAILYPQLEQGGLYEKLSTCFSNGTSNLARVDSIAGLEKDFGGFAGYRCPSASGSLTSKEDTYIGPVSGYCLLSAFNIDGKPESDRLDIGPGILWNPDTTEPAISGVQEKDAMPIRAAVATGINAANQPVPASDTSITRWEPRDDLSFWSDGTSNQFILSEKGLGEKDPDADTPYNGGILTMDSKKVGTIKCVARHIGFYSTLTAFLDNGTILGSSHTAVMNMLLGDGAVRGVPKTTPAEIIWKLTVVNDMQAVDIP